MDIPENKTENKTEKDYIDLCKDFKEIIEKKNKKIEQLLKLIFVCYGLTRRGLETEDMALFEECRGSISEFFDELFEFN